MVLCMYIVVMMYMDHDMLLQSHCRQDLQCCMQYGSCLHTSLQKLLGYFKTYWVTSTGEETKKRCMRSQRMITAQKRSSI